MPDSSDTLLLRRAGTEKHNSWLAQFEFNVWQPTSG
jgi:hypothetical protein